MKQMRPLVTPAARENLTVGRKGDRPDLTAAIFSNVREHITVVYASPPLDLRLSPGDREGDATLRKGGSPMSGESPLALAVCDAPQPYCAVIRPTDELPRISWVELDAGDTIAAIFSNVRFLVNFSTPLPR
jgi:hypothetical protein